MGLLYLIRMRRRNGSIQSSLLLFGVVFTQSLAGQSLSLPASAKASEPITEMLANTLSKSEIPGVIAAIAEVDQPTQVGCAGLRHFDETILVFGGRQSPFRLLY